MRGLRGCGFDAVVVAVNGFVEVVMGYLDGEGFGLSVEAFRVVRRVCVFLIVGYKYIPTE